MDEEESSDHEEVEDENCHKSSRGAPGQMLVRGMGAKE
jgi:hypothetical protein